MKVGRSLRTVEKIGQIITDVNFNPSIKFLTRPELNVYNNSNNPNVTPLALRLEGVLGFVETISINYQIK